MKWYSVVAILTESFVWIFVLVWMLASRYECCCFGLIALRRQQDGGPARPMGGLDPAEIESYPSFGYPKVEDHQGAKMSRGITECAICLSVFVEGETLRLIPMCGHVFHADCVDVWLRTHATCPYCRANLLLPSPQTTTELPV